MISQSHLMLAVVLTSIIRGPKLQQTKDSAPIMQAAEFMAATLALAAGTHADIIVNVLVGAVASACLASDEKLTSRILNQAKLSLAVRL